MAIYRANFQLQSIRNVKKGNFTSFEAFLTQKWCLIDSGFFPKHECCSSKLFSYLKSMLQANLSHDLSAVMKRRSQKLSNFYEPGHFPNVFRVKELDSALIFTWNGSNFCEIIVHFRSFLVMKILHCSACASICHLKRRSFLPIAVIELDKNYGKEPKSSIIWLLPISGRVHQVMSTFRLGFPD